MALLTYQAKLMVHVELNSMQVYILARIVVLAVPAELSAKL